MKRLLLPLLAIFTASAACHSSLETGTRDGDVYDILLINVATEECREVMSRVQAGGAYDPRCGLAVDEARAQPTLKNLRDLYLAYDSNDEVCRNFADVDHVLDSVSGGHSDPERLGRLEATYLRGKLRLYCGKENWRPFIDEAMRGGLRTNNWIYPE